MRDTEEPFESRLLVRIEGLEECIQQLALEWAICADGSKQMVHLACAGSETRDAWSAFFEEMTERGLRQPLLVVSDGAKA